MIYRVKCVESSRIFFASSCLWPDLLQIFLNLLEIANICPKSSKNGLNSSKNTYFWPILVYFGQFWPKISQKPCTKLKKTCTRRPENGDQTAMVIAGQVLIFTSKMQGNLLKIVNNQLLWPLLSQYDTTILASYRKLQRILF